jgi:peptide-O-fucosyltransferase
MCKFFLFYFLLFFQSRACEYVPSSPLLFAAAQCLGYRNENGVASADLCMPALSTIVRQLKKAVNKVRYC